MRVIVLVVGLWVSPMGLAPALAQSDFWFVPQRGPYRELVERYRAADPAASPTFSGVSKSSPTQSTAASKTFGHRTCGPSTMTRYLTSTNSSSAPPRCFIPTPPKSCGPSGVVRPLFDTSSWLASGSRPAPATFPPLWSVPSGSRDRRFRGPGSRGGAGSFRRRWYLAAGLLVLTREGFIPAIEFLEDASRTVPDDVALLTTTGWLKERLALAAVYVRGMPLVAIRRAKERELTAAAEWLRQALEVDPEAPEAAVRLARIQMLLGDDDAAETGLTRLVDRTDLSPDHAYLSRLLLGRLYEDREEPDRAVPLYEEASAILPRSQSVWVALARLSLESGDWRTAVAAVERPLQDSATPEVDRPLD